MERTFDAQKNLVNNTIVPTVIATLDAETFPVTDAVVYEIIHSRHKHQREEYLIKQQSEKYQDEQNRRKHLNSRRNDVNNELVLFDIFVIFTILLFYL